MEALPAVVCYPELALAFHLSRYSSNVMHVLKCLPALVFLMKGNTRTDSSDTCYDHGTPKGLVSFFR